MSSEVTIIDYGMGNLYSVQRALERCGAGVTVTSDPEIVLRSPKLVLPGVGAFGNAMRELSNRDLLGAIQGFAKSGRPLLGICLGMQLFLDESEEFGQTKGLGLVPGRVIPIQDVSISGEPQKVPHIGWNALQPEPGRSWSGTSLSNVRTGQSVYFVHSYQAVPTDDSHRLANCIYGGHPIAAVIGRDNILGCQFHPEKSGAIGLGILSSFCEQ